MKKIVDENGRIFGKVSIIDLFVVLIVVVLIIVASMKTSMNKAQSAVTSGEPIRYTLRISGSTIDCSSILKPGDVIYASSGPAVGNVVSVIVAPANATSANLNGEYVTSTLNGKYEAIVVVETPVSISGGRYLVGNTWEINTGTNRDYYTKYYSFTGTITEIG